MCATTEEARERESKVDKLMEDVPFDRMDPPPSELAPETPLTREAAIHLRAAAAEVSRAYGDVHALLDTVERALSEPTGGEKVFSEEERMNLGRLVRQAQKKADEEMQRPVFERGRGERPHGDGPYLSLDAEKLDELVLRLTTAICVGLHDQRDSEELRYKRQKKSGMMVDDTIKWIEEEAGADLYGDEMHDRASERAQTVVEELAAEVEDETTPRDDGAEPEETEEVMHLAQLALAASAIAVRLTPAVMKDQRRACIQLECDVEDAVKAALPDTPTPRVSYDEASKLADEYIADPGYPRGATEEGESRE